MEKKQIEPDQTNVKLETKNKQHDQWTTPDGKIQTPVAAFGTKIFDPEPLPNGYGAINKPGTRDLEIPVGKSLPGAAQGPSLKPTTTSGKMGEKV